MAYGSFDGLATVLTHGPRFQAVSTAALKVGELVDHLFAQADASAGVGTARYVSLEGMASGDTGWFAEWAVLRKPSTIGVGGDVTAGSHGGTLGDVLFLSATAGDAVEVIDGDGIYQIVGKVLSTQDVLIKPSTDPGDFFEHCEKETSAKTTDKNDSGKALVFTSTTNIEVTLQATHVGDHIVLVNGAQDGDHLTTISPNGSDKIIGWDFTGSNDGDVTNTKATSKAGDYLELLAEGVDGWVVMSGRGVWAGA